MAGRGDAADAGMALTLAPTDDATQRDRRAQAHTLLLAWYAREGRATLPWRRTRDPYAVLVSEMMLQQTQVERVLPKYQAFLTRFPTLAALAVAPTSEVIKEWAGLGYNLRAVRLHGIAKQAMAQGGALPTTLDGLLALKGIGRYTAGAVACFGLGLPVATVDTNIRRVLWRVFQGIEPAAWPTGEAASRAMFALAEWALPAAPDADAAQDALPVAIAATTPAAVQPAHTSQAPHTSAEAQRNDRPARVYDWQQALMDLGAMVCQARRPACEHCPLTTVCAAYSEVAQVTLFPSGEALARLRDARAEASRLEWAVDAAPDDAPHAMTVKTAATEAQRIAERRMGYAADGVNDGATEADTPHTGSAIETPAHPAQPDQPARPRRRGDAKARPVQPFTTTSRYFRGRIVDALRTLPAGEALSLAELGPQVKADFTADEAGWLRGLVDGLARDGLARIVDPAGETDADLRISLP